MRIFHVSWKLILLGRYVSRYTESLPNLVILWHFYSRLAGTKCSREQAYLSREKLTLYIWQFGRWGSSVSRVSDYGLDDQAIEVQSPAGAKDSSSSLYVQTSCGFHPDSFPIVTGGPFPGGKMRPGSDADQSPYLVPRSWMSRSYTFSTPAPPYVCCVTALYLTWRAVWR
jgi:hypothetical protein